MNLKNWVEYKKIENGSPAPTNMVYVPLMNPDGDRLCMDFGNSRIHFDNHFFFERELHYLQMFAKYNWIPDILDVDRNKKKIYLKWYRETCNNIIETGRIMEESCIDWKKQLIKIMEDIDRENVYKINVYTHCFYIDSDRKLRAIDFYACVDHTDCLVPLETVTPIIGKLSVHRWNESILDEKVDFKKFYMNGLSEHIIWPEHVLRKWAKEKNVS